MPAKLIAAALWALIALGVIVIVIMTWHPWVAGQRAGCPPQSARAWDGHCYPDHIGG